jgi:orotate phosphoribosyltransferase
MKSESLKDRERLLELLQTRSLEEREVILSSGRKSNYYLDCKRVTLTPEGAYLSAKILLGMIEPEVKAVGGLTLGADPLVVSIAVLSYLQAKSMQSLPALIVRKEPKKHGTMSFVEGPILEKGSAVAVVEDVITSGASIIRAIDRIEAEGYQPVQALAILDRLEGGNEAVEKRGLKLQSIFTRDDLKISR